MLEMLHTMYFQQGKQFHKKWPGCSKTPSKMKFNHLQSFQPLDFTILSSAYYYNQDVKVSVWISVSQGQIIPLYMLTCAKKEFHT